MSTKDTAPAGANPEIKFDQHGIPLIHVDGSMFVRHPDYINALPYIERGRMTWPEFRQHMLEQGLEEPTKLQWFETFDLTQNEIDMAMAIQQKVYEASFNDLAGYAFIRDYAGQPRIVWRRGDGSIGNMKVHDFKTAHGEKLIEVGEDKQGLPKYRPLVDAWLEHTKTPRFETVQFLPGRRPWEAPDGIYNLWAGWPEGLERTRDKRPHVLGDLIPDDDEYDGEDEPAECSLFLEHLYEHVCGGDHEVYNFTLGWMANGLLRPGHSEVAIVMTGPSGSGKGTFAEFYGSLFGPHFLSTSKREHVIGKFNKHLMDCQLLFGDEIDFKSNTEANQQLRNLVTEPTMPIEAKGVDVIQAPKHFRVIIATNERHVVGALHDDRRFLVLNVDAGEHNKDRPYFAAMRRHWYEQGGRVALFRWLTGRHWREYLDSGGWDVGQRPETEALQEQKEMSLPRAEMVVHNMLMGGEVPCEFESDSDDGTVFVAAHLLADARRLNEKDVTPLGKALRVAAGTGARNIRYQVAGERRRGYWLPPLKLARQYWEGHLGHPVAWPDDVPTWAVETEPMRGADGLPF